MKADSSEIEEHDIVLNNKFKACYRFDCFCDFFKIAYANIQTTKGELS